MNQTQPGDPEPSSPLPGGKRSRRGVLFWSASASLAAIALGAVVFLFLRPRDSAVKDAQPMDPTRPEESWLEAKDFSASNSVSIVLGEKESGNGLEHLATERDGLTATGTVN